MTTADGTSADQVGLALNSDASTSVAWTRPSSPSTQSLLVTRVNGARVGASTTVAADWATLANPSIVRGNLTGQTRVFFGGRHTTDSEDPNNELNDAISTDDARTFAVEPASIVAPGTLAYGSAVSAAFSDGAGFQEVWASTLGLFTHFGPTADVPVTPHTSAPSSYDPGLAIGGDMVTAYYSNDSGAPGVYALRMNLDGTETAAPQRMPQTGGMKFGMSARTPITFLEGPRNTANYYVAYPTGTSLINKIRVWEVGSSSAVQVGRSRVNGYATITPTPQGRLWVSWTDRIDGDAVVFARRSNIGATRWGATVEAGAPNNAQSAYAIDGMSDEANELNVFTSFSLGTSEHTATYVRHQLPGLTLARVSGHLDDDQANTVTFKVTDAGDAVAGAHVRLGGQTATTSSSGTARITVKGRGSSMTARATASRYVAAEVDLRVRD